MIANFVATNGITFPILRDRAPWAIGHYGFRFWSEFRLLDKQGDRVRFRLVDERGNPVDSPAFFDAGLIERLLAALEASAS